MVQTREDFLCAEITDANAFITDSNVRGEKYDEMQKSPSQFYRATNHLYYADLGHGTISLPDVWKAQPNCNIWLSGDFHTQNIGYSDDNADKVIFDLNDADESYIGPFYWDLIRFSTSLYLLTDEIGKTQMPHGNNFAYAANEQESLVVHFLQTYQDTLRLINGNNDETSIAIDEAHLRDGFIRDKLRDLQKKKQIDLLGQWTARTNGDLHFEEKNKKNGKKAKLARMTDEEKTGLLNNWTGYTQSLSPSFLASRNKHYFTIKDSARRLHSGLGSLGVDKYYVLIEGDNSSSDNEQILEVKEQLQPSLFKEGSRSLAQYNAWFANPAQRSVIASRALGIRIDEHLGVILFNGKSFRVRRLPPSRYGFEVVDFSRKSDVSDFVTYAARALALAHARSDKDYSPTYINYNFEQAYFDALAVWPQFKTTVNNLSKVYYQQVLADHKMFIDLVRAERIVP